MQRARERTRAQRLLRQTEKRFIESSGERPGYSKALKDDETGRREAAHISVRVAELQEEQLAIHQQATAAAAANKQVTIESLIAEAEAARAKAMSEKGGAAAAVSALTAKAKLAGMWREKVDQHNTGNPVYERIERVIVERPPQSAPGGIPDESSYDEPPTEVAREMPRRPLSA